MANEDALSSSSRNAATTVMLRPGARGCEVARWPAKREDQVLALWALWAQVPSRRDFTEQEISQVLRDLHDFGDHALLRRELFESRLVTRTPDCRAYRRIEQPPPADAAELIRQVQAAN